MRFVFLEWHFLRAMWTMGCSRTHPGGRQKTPSGEVSEGKNHYFSFQFNSIFTENLLCCRYCVKCWRHKDEEDTSLFSSFGGDKYRNRITTLCGEYTWEKCGKANEWILEAKLLQPGREAGVWEGFLEKVKAEMSFSPAFEYLEY